MAMQSINEYLQGDPSIHIIVGSWITYWQVQPIVLFMYTKIRVAFQLLLLQLIKNFYKFSSDCILNKDILQVSQQLQVLQQYKTSPNSLFESPPGSSVKSWSKHNVCRPIIIAIRYCYRTIDKGHVYNHYQMF